MISRQKITYLMLSLAFIKMDVVYSIFPINYLRPYDELYYLGSQGKKFQLYGVAEYGFKSLGRTEDGDRVCPFQLWQCSQSTLAMLKGFPASSDIGQFAQQFSDDADDGVRGHVIPRADVEYTGGIVSGRWFVPYDVSVSFHIPVYSINVKNVSWQDLTKDITSEDELVKEQLTSQLAQRTCEFGNLDIGGWKQTGIGDVVLQAQWLKTYPQIKPLLRKVTLNVRGGLSLPTAKHENINQALVIPFGNEGSAGAFLAGGIRLDWNFHLRAGLDAFFMHLFGSTRNRRIKTDPAQTDLLLLQCAKSWCDYAVTQRYNIFLEINKFFKGLSFRTTYQFWQHGGDVLSLMSNDYSTAVANTAQRYDDWTMHNLIFTLLYDTADDLPDAGVTPQLSLYYKYPLNGSNSLLMHGVGGALFINF